MIKIKALIKERLGNKEGSSVIEFAISLMILVLLICFLFDVIIIANKKYTVSQQVNSLSRQIAIQGGLSQKAPTGFLGGDRIYVSGDEVISTLNSNLASAGIDKDKWKVTLKGYDKNGKVVSTTNFTGNSANVPANVSVDYGRGIDVNIDYTYSWSLFGQITGSLKNITRGEQRHVVSEFKFNYDDWDGEK